MTDGQVAFCLTLCFALGFFLTWLNGGSGIP
jgi:hypothetical protein